MSNERATVDLMEAGEVRPGEGLRDLAAEAAQASLFGQDDDDAVAQFPKLAEQRQGPGRPKGSRNRTTRQTLQILAQSPNYRDPLLVLASISTMSPEQLKSAYGLKGSEAISAQIRAASDLAPYIHSKQPQGVKISGTPGAPVNIMIGAWATAAPDIQGGVVVDGEAVEFESAPPDISTGYDDEGNEVAQQGSRTDDASD